MTSSIARSCNPRFPAKGVLVDNSALVRLWKCQILYALADTVELHVAHQVWAEFRKQGPSERAAIDHLGVVIHRVGPTSQYWGEFSRLRGGRYSTRDLGDDELLAIAKTHAAEGLLLPIVTYDNPATNDAAREGLVTLDFLDTLAWLVACGRLTAEEADAAERRARKADGFRPPPGYGGAITDVRVPRQHASIARVSAWTAARA